MFTDAERAYLAGQRLGRLATVGPDGGPQVRPTGFEVRADGTLDIGGADLPRTRKYRNVQERPQVAFVVDDLETTDPWRPRGVEIRGRAEAVGAPEPRIRIRPDRIVSWGLDGDGLTPRSRRVRH